MPTTLTSMTPTAIVSSIVESTSRQLEGTFGELEGTFGDLEGTFSELESTFSSVEGVLADAYRPILTSAPSDTHIRIGRYSCRHRPIFIANGGREIAQRDER